MTIGIHWHHNNRGELFWRVLLLTYNNFVRLAAMLIHRYNAQHDPYGVTFEMRPDTCYYEQVIARSATAGLNRHDHERIGMDLEEATAWAMLGFSITARNNGEFIHNEKRFDKERLRRFGSLLAYFADTTEEELQRIANNNPPDKIIFGNRLYEGRIAQDMYETINSRLKVPKLWQPNQSVRVIGFR